MSDQTDLPREETVELDHEAIGFTESLAIGLSSTAPAYSLAAVIGTVTVIVGVQAPAAMLASFVPMFLIAAAFYYLNRADQDAGTTFSWVTRTLGPWAGWIGGWAICTTGILVIGSLADVGARYFYILVGWDSAAESKWAVIALAVAIIVVMTAICIVGTELSARLQTWMTIAQVAVLLLFAFVALGKVYADDGLEGSTKPQGDWFSPFAVDGLSPLVSALLIGVFIYWGLESAVKSAFDLADAENSYSGQTILGLGVPLAIALAFFLLGAILLVLWRLGGNERFFGRKPFEAVDPAAAA